MEKNQFTPEEYKARRQEIKELIESGASLSDIARKFSISRERVRQLNHSLGLPTKRSLVAQYKEKALALIKSKELHDTEVADMTGLSPTTVGYIRKRDLGIDSIVIRKTLKRQYPAEFNAYRMAEKRCQDNDHPNYSSYGGRGIQFKFTSFGEFMAELGPKPAGITPSGRSAYSLNRIDNNGHYEIGNVEWTTQDVQCRNRRKRVLTNLKKLPY